MTTAASVALRQQAQHRRQQQHRRHRGTRGHQRCLLRLSARGRARPPSATCRRRPAWRRTTRPPRLAAPVATSSRFASIGGSPGRAKARPAAIVSVKLISAMPSAPGTSCWTSARSGSVSDGNPCGMRPTVETPSAFRPKYHDAAMRAADGDQRRRRMRPQPLHADQYRERRGGDRQRQQRRFGNVVRRRLAGRQRILAW